MNKTVIETTNAPGAIGPYSQGWTVGDLIFTSGQIPVDPATGAIAEGITAQAEQSCKNVGAILAAAGVGRSAMLLAVDAGRRDALGGQLPCDDVSTFAVHQETAVHLADDCRLLGIHCQFPTPQGKPVNIIASEHHTALHRALLPPLDALRDFAALLLRYRCHYRKPQLAVEIHRRSGGCRSDLQ